MLVSRVLLFVFGILMQILVNIVIFQAANKVKIYLVFKLALPPMKMKILAFTAIMILELPFVKKQAILRKDAI